MTKFKKYGPVKYTRVGKLFYVHAFGFGICGILDGWHSQFEFCRNG